MTIYKYPLEITDEQAVMMPTLCKIITVQMQHGKPCLWAIVNEHDRISRLRTIDIFGTGNPMDNQERAYIGTIQQAGGALVWHVFERL